MRTGEPRIRGRRVSDVGLDVERRGGYSGGGTRKRRRAADSRRPATPYESSSHTAGGYSGATAGLPPNEIRHASPPPPRRQVDAVYVVRPASSRSAGDGLVIECSACRATLTAASSTTGGPVPWQRLATCGMTGASVAISTRAAGYSGSGSSSGAACPSGASSGRCTQRSSRGPSERGPRLGAAAWGLSTCPLGQNPASRRDRNCPIAAGMPIRRASRRSQDCEIPNCWAIRSRS